MAESEVPLGAWLAFGTAWVAGLAFFACLYTITRKLGMSWNRRFGGASLNTSDAVRVGKLMIGLEKAPDVEVKNLVWAVRTLWALMLISIIAFSVIVAGVA